MKRSLVGILLAVPVWGCGQEWQESLTKPGGIVELQQTFSSVGKGRQRANDAAVRKLGLEKGSDNPPFMSFGWISERLREMRIGGDSGPDARPQDLGGER